MLLGPLPQAITIKKKGGLSPSFEPRSAELWFCAFRRRSRPTTPRGSNQVQAPKVHKRRCGSCGR